MFRVKVRNTLPLWAFNLIFKLDGRLAEQARSITGQDQ
jgi:hypothetical protein